MGYCASGCGTATFKKDCNIKELERALKEIDDPLIYDINEEGIFFENDTSHYNEDNTKVFLETLTPYIVEGCMEYTSHEDDSIWRFKFDAGKSSWVEENATIDYGFESYSDDDLIRELANRGYDVSGLSKDGMYMEF